MHSPTRPIVFIRDFSAALAKCLKALTASSTSGPYFSSARICTASGYTAEAPNPNTAATWCEEHSWPLSAIKETRNRRPSSMRRWLIAEMTMMRGMAARSLETWRSEITAMPPVSRANPSTASHRSSIARTILSALDTASERSTR
ncbi:Uncharacterised protein [Mycobacteroides abscessus subsp. abscessus]|nr:Uncharacterised protein [Mycobacteroides abscessus subsp. abscessus]